MLNILVAALGYLPNFSEILFIVTFADIVEYIFLFDIYIKKNIV